MKICLLTDHHICTNPRLWKEALSLSKAGYTVQVITVFTSAEKKVLDYQILSEQQIELIPALNLIPTECSFFKRLYYRLRFRIAREIKLKFNIDSAAILGYGASAIEREAKKAKASLYIAHIDLCLYVGVKLRKQGYPVAFDIEDWYSHDYLVPERPIKLLQKLEQYALANGIYCTCPSQAMADALNHTYPNSKSAHVIYNGFSISEIRQSKVEINQTPSLVWFSQTIGPGRGLETIIQALFFMNKDVELHLIGDCSLEYKKHLENIFPQGKGQKLVIHKQVKHSELLSILMNYNIGLAIENKFPESRNLTVTNKILQYIQAGIKILATDTEGQKEIAKYFNDTIILVSSDDPKSWATQIEALLNREPVRLSLERKNYVELFSWEAQESKLLNLVNSAIND